jgi:hypothetical protein
MSIANQPKRRLTVTTAAADQLLCTVANAKIDIGISGSTEDAYLTRLVAQSSKMIANYCGRVFKQETVTETFEVTYPAGFLMLSRFPVGTVTSVKIDGVALLAANYHIETATGYLPATRRRVPVDMLGLWARRSRLPRRIRIHPGRPRGGVHSACESQARNP